MMKTIRFIFSSLIALLTLSILPSTSQAVSLIDNFIDSQQVIDIGGPGATDSTVFLSAGASDLTGIRRTLSAEASAGAINFMVMIAGGGILGITNSPGSAGTASILWDNFGTVDFTQGGNTAFKLEVLALDNKTISVEMRVNGSSNAVNAAISSVGEYLFDFASFSDASLFNQLTSLEMRLSGPPAWDGQFKLSTVSTPVPLPPSFFLMGLALAGFAFTRRNSLDV